MMLNQKELLLLILSCIKYNQCHAKLTKMSKNRFVKPGTSCGVLKSIKILHEFPKNSKEIQPCTIVDLNGNHRESPINIDTIAATTMSTPTTATTRTTTTTTTPTTTATSTTTTIAAATTTTTTTTAASKECHPDFIGDGTCDEECNNGDYNGNGDYNYFDYGDCCPEEIDIDTFYSNGYKCN